MTHYQLCERFVRGLGVSRRCGSLRYCDNVLYSYNTEIARKIGDAVFYSVEPLTATTGRHISQLRWAAEQAGFSTYPVQYNMGDSFRSDLSMLCYTYRRLLEDIASLLGRWRGASDSLKYKRNRNHLLRLAGALVQSFAGMRKHYPQLLDPAPVLHAVKLAVRETKANRRRWRNNVSFITDDLMAFLRRATDTKRSEWRSAEDLRKEALQAQYVEEHSNDTLHDLSNQLRELEGVARHGSLSIEQQALHAALLAVFRAALTCRESTISPFYLLNSRNILFPGALGDNCQVPTALFRKMEKLREVHTDARSRHLRVDVYLAGSTHTLTYAEGPDRVIIGLNVYYIALEVYEVIVELIKEEDAKYENSVEFAAD